MFLHNERNSLAAKLFLIGQRIVECEQTLRKQGFSAFEFAQDMVRSFAQSEDELREYEIFRAESAAEAISSFGFLPNNTPFPSPQSTYLQELRRSSRSECIGLPCRLKKFSSTHPKEYLDMVHLSNANSRAQIRNESSRFRAFVEGYDVRIPAHRVTLAKEAFCQLGAQVPDGRSFSEPRPVFAYDMGNGYSLIARLPKASLFMAPAATEPEFGLRFFIVHNCAKDALGCKYTSSDQYMEIQPGLFGLFIYGKCTSLEEVYCTGTVYGLVARWMRDEFMSCTEHPN